MNSEFDKPSLEKERNILSFGRFRFDRETKVLLDGADVVQLAPKTCALLDVLISSRGKVLSKSELMDRVWPGTFVEESNLTHHIASLRKALGNADLIQTVPRKGYRFAGAVEEEPASLVEISIKQSQKTSIYEDVIIDETPVAVSRYRWPVYVGAAFTIGVIAVAGVLVAYVRSGAAPRAERKPLTYSTVTNSGVNNSASISPDGRLIAYVQNHKNQKGALYVRQVGTNIEKELFSDENSNFGMTGFSPDGAFIFFVQQDTASGKYLLNRVPVLGGPVVLMSDKCRNGHFALSPNATKAAVVRYDEEERTSRLIQIELDGTGRETEILSTNYADMQLQVGGSWSPNGSKIVLPVRDPATTDNFKRNLVNLAEIDLATKKLKAITDETWEVVGISRWMPDSSGIIVIAKKPRLRNQIYFVAYPSGTVRNVTNDANTYSNYGLGITSDGDTLVTDDWKQDSRIWILDANGDQKTAVRMMLGKTSSMFAGLSQLPDGRMVFANRVGGTSDIYLLEKDGESQIPLTSDQFDDSFPVASNDGKTIVFISDRGGDGPHVFRIGSDGSGLRQLTFGSGSNETPSISPDQKWILYQSTFFDVTKNAWTYTIKRIPFDGGEPVQLVDTCYAPSFSPDGTKFACTVFITHENGNIEIHDSQTGVLLNSFPAKWSYHHQLPVRWTPDGQALVYRDQQKQVGNLWKQPIAGGPPIQFTRFISEIIFNFDYSKDGKKLLVARGSGVVDVVKFSNLKDAIGN